MKRMLWMDLEMTGLDPKTDAIIEVAALVTDLELRPLEQYHAVIYQPQSELAKMDDWNQHTHRASGLIDEIPKGILLKDAERDLLQLVGSNFPDESPVLCGNSIHQDRKFIDKYLPSLAARLHYRMIDVSAFKQIFANLYQVRVQKTGGHRALDDIRESIDELRTYLNYIYVETPTQRDG